MFLRVRGVTAEYWDSTLQYASDGGTAQYWDSILQYASDGRTAHCNR